MLPAAAVVTKKSHWYERRCLAAASIVRSGVVRAVATLGKLLNESRVAHCLASAKMVKMQPQVTLIHYAEVAKPGQRREV